jgi:2-C-methyl-D-erythritol 2,4-cyclodiphosphate synthase
MTTPEFDIRVGEGWDIHALVPGRKLVIGGVEIPFAMGLLGNSDADVLLHAITDALLGAAAMGDIGTHFPDTGTEYKDADSWGLLQRICEMLRLKGYLIVNVDCTVVAQAPKLAPYIAPMRDRIATALQIDAGRVNVKAKTAEKLGPTGQGQSIEARAVALLRR